MGRIFDVLALLRLVATAWEKTMTWLTGRENRKAGAQDAEIKGRKIIEDIGNDQDKRASVPLTDDAVADRLRKRTG